MMKTTVVSEISERMNKAYEDGWNDCLKQMSDESFSVARIRQLEINYKELKATNIIQKRRLALAIRLLRLAQRSECGQLGQYDRFFEEGYHSGFEEEV